MKPSDIKKLTLEWKILIISFFASASILFVYSIALVSKAGSCEYAGCLLSSLSSFVFVAFFLLVINVLAVVFFLISFFYRESIKEKKNKARKGRRGFKENKSKKKAHGRQGTKSAGKKSHGKERGPAKRASKIRR